MSESLHQPGSRWRQQITLRYDKLILLQPLSNCFESGSGEEDDAFQMMSKLNGQRTGREERLDILCGET